MSTPPGQPPGASGHQRGAPQQATPPKKRAWPRRHPIWSAVIAVFAIFVLLVIIGSVASPPSTPTSHTAAAPTPAPPPSPTPTPAVVPATVAVPPTCQALASSRRPRDHTTVKITVSTVAPCAGSRHRPPGPSDRRARRGRADASGLRTVRFRVGDATPGVRVIITVRVSRHGSKGTCRTSLRPRKVKPVQVTAPPAPPPAPSSPAAAPRPTATSCYPRSDSGTCYRPGEFCRTSDHGMTGVAGDGEKIICEDNNGWRWEPA